MSVCQCNNLNCTVDPGGHNGTNCFRRATRNSVIISSLELTLPHEIINQCIDLRYVCDPCKQWWQTYLP